MSKEQNSTQVSKILRLASERSVPVELHRRNHGDELEVGRTRILSMDENALFLDKPQCIGKAFQTAAGQELDGFFWMQETLYRFRTVVVNPALIIPLNQHKKISGLSVSRPIQLENGQRRSTFRVSLAAGGAIPVELHSTSPEEPGACPVAASRHAGTLVDLSVGGASIRLPKVPQEKLPIGQSFFLSFVLPGDSRRLFYLAEIRQSRSILEGTVTRVGMRFLNWPDEAHMRMQQQLVQRYITTVQRASLKRSA